jgi:hypothetical protein
MNRLTVTEAVRAAEEFIIRAEKALEAGIVGPHSTESCRLSAAVRRQSMELTHALSDMRKCHR